MKYELLLASFIAFPVYASSDINARLTQTELHQGSHIKNIGITASPNTSMRTLLKNNLAHIGTYTGGAMFSTQVFSSSDDIIPVGESHSFSAHFNVYIENYSNKLKTYKIIYIVCADKFDPNACANLSDKLELLPGDYIEYTKGMQYNYTFTKPTHTQGMAMVTLTPDNGVSEYGASSETFFTAA